MSLRKIFRTAAVVTGGLAVALLTAALIPDFSGALRRVDMAGACLKADSALEDKAHGISLTFLLLAYRPAEGYQLPMTERQAQDFFAQTDWREAGALNRKFDETVLTPALMLPYECVPFKTARAGLDFENSQQRLLEMSREAMRQKPEDYIVPVEFWQWYGDIVPGFRA